MVTAPEREGDPEGETPPRGIDWLGLLWRRKALLFLGLALGLVGGGFYHAQSPPVFQTSAQVLVVKKVPATLPVTAVDSEAALNGYEDYLATHQVILRSPLVLRRAGKKVAERRLASFAAPSEPAAALAAGLSVGRPKSPGNILELSYRSRQGNDSPAVLEAVIDSYREFLQEAYRVTSDDSVALIQKARQVLEKDLAEKEAAYAVFRQTSPLLGTGKERSNAPQETLAAAQAARSTLQLRRAETQGRLTALEAAVRAGRSRPTLLAMVSSLPGSSPDLRGARPLVLEDQLLPLLLEEKLLAEDYGPDHPKLLSLRTRIGFIRDYFTRPEPTRGVGEEVGTAPTDAVELHLQTLRAQLQDLDALDQAYAALVERQSNEARKLVQYEIRDEQFRADLARTQQLFDSILKRLQEVNLVKDFGGFNVEVITPPGEAVQVAPLATRNLTLGAVLGLFAGLGLAYLAEITDAGFRSAEEIRRHLGLPVLGNVPFQEVSPDAPAGSGKATVLCTRDAPTSPGAESYRTIRTALFFRTSGEGHRVLQITSADRGDGKTTLAANLAVSLAQAGHSVLLVDADLRRPRLHQVFGVGTPGVGLAQVLASTSPLGEALVPTAIAGLTLLPAGRRPANPAELLLSARLPEFLAVVRAQYDYVLLDTPPLLAVTDPGTVAPRSDGVILTVRLSRKARPAATRAREILAGLGARVLGVVVNCAEAGASYRAYAYGDYDQAYADGEESEAGEPLEPAPAPACPPRPQAPADEGSDESGRSRRPSGTSPAPGGSAGVPARPPQTPARLRVTSWDVSWD